MIVPNSMAEQCGKQGPGELVILLQGMLDTFAGRPCPASICPGLCDLKRARFRNRLKRQWVLSLFTTDYFPVFTRVHLFGEFWFLTSVRLGNEMPAIGKNVTPPVVSGNQACRETKVRIRWQTINQDHTEQTIAEFTWSVKVG